MPRPADCPRGLGQCLPSASRHGGSRVFFDLYDRRLTALTRTRPFSDVAEYTSTLLAVVAHPPCLAYLSVGDAFLVLQRGADGPHLLVAGDPDGAAATTFLTTPGRIAEVRRGVVADRR